MNLIASIEDMPGVRIVDHEVMLESVETIKAIVATVDRARSERAAGLVERKANVYAALRQGS